MARQSCLLACSFSSQLNKTTKQQMQKHPAGLGVWALVGKKGEKQAILLCELQAGFALCSCVLDIPLFVSSRCHG
jgi:hypothetical protein